MTISDTLLTEVKRRLDNGESIRGIAHAAGISAPALNRFVNGQRTLTLPSADLLADHLELELGPGEMRKAPVDPRTELDRLYRSHGLGSRRIDGKVFSVDDHLNNIRRLNRMSRAMGEGDLTPRQIKQTLHFLPSDYVAALVKYLNASKG
ncbi:MAG: helix-turn-helix transcriptional regulator [Planctomycetes bacterium]|nr:helix-turn-helix transcriptional regulator [Planctomycetota bacterium]